MKTMQIFKILQEGRIKQRMEDKIEKMCICDGGCSLDVNEHKKSCPAYKKLKDDTVMDDEIDRAEYQSGEDR